MKSHTNNCLLEPTGHEKVAIAQQRVHTKQALGAGGGQDASTRACSLSNQTWTRVSRIYGRMTNEDRGKTTSRNGLKEQTRLAHMTSAKLTQLIRTEGQL